ncbi:MAG: DUF885 family protein [Sphingomonadales bacterium]|nr:DUF885 family protein [Sphingomonadales bacterium]
MSLQTRQDCCNFIDGLRAIPAYFAGGLDSLKLAQSKGYRMPRVLAPRIRGMIEAQLAESGIESLVRGRFAVRPRLLDVSEFSQLQNEAERVVREHVRPALVSLIDYFSDENRTSGATAYQFVISQMVRITIASRFANKRQRT